MEKPKVSVILPTYNRASCLGRAIKSVLDQTFKDFEIIVIDDGSQDNTAEIIKGFGDLRIRYIRFDENRGVSAVRNEGIKNARGRYIAFQDSDDEWYREKLARQMDVFKSAPDKVGVVYSRIWRISANKKSYVPGDKPSKKEGDIHQVLLNANFVAMTSAVVKKECFLRTGMFDEFLPALGDWELWIRISEYFQFIYVPEVLVDVYYSADSLTFDQEKFMISLEHILEKHHDAFRKCGRKLLSKGYIKLAKFMYICGDIKKGRGCLVKAYKENPLNVKILTYLAISFFGQSIYKKLLNYFYKDLDLNTHEKRIQGSDNSP